MEKETKTLNFVEVTDYFIFINIDKNTCFQIGKDNKFYGVDSAVIDDELKFERAKGVFEKKTYVDLKKFDVWFYDEIGLNPENIRYLINTNPHISLYFSQTEMIIKDIPSYWDKDTSVWILKK